MIFGYFEIRLCRGTIEPTCAIEEEGQLRWRSGISNNHDVGGLAIDNLFSRRQGAT